MAQALPTYIDTFLALHTMMVRIRLFEEKTAELFRANQIKGTAHSSIGQEAIAAATGAVLRKDDYLVGHHRSHGHVLAKGASMDRMMAELLGRRTGYCKGLGGSMHIANLSLGILGCNGVVGAGTALGTGSALSSSLRGEDRITLVLFGDGAANEGVVHEAMNLASVWKLPVLFVCENNQFALTTEWREGRAVEDIATRASAYGIPGEIVDGNDVLAVRDVLARHVEQMRDGNGPSLVEAKTYRRMEHSMRANLPETRSAEVKMVWEKNDPIARFEQFLRTCEHVSQEQLDAIWEKNRQEVEVAVHFAMESELANVGDLMPAVYVPHRQDYAEPQTSERRISFVPAVREAIEQEMAADERVVMIGEDVRMGGIFRATEGLLERFGAQRVRNTPISESGFVGTAVGAAMTGLRPVVEIQIFDFVTLAMDAIVNQAAKLRFMMGGGPTIPLVVRGPSGGGVKLGAQHSQSLEAWFAHIPGLVVVAPSNPYDAKGLLAAAIRDDNPVVFLETKMLQFSEGIVPEERYALPLGKAAVVRAGTDVTVVATQAMVTQAVRAAQRLEQEGVSVEVIDPRTLYPLDIETIVNSVKKTNRMVVVHEAVTFAGIGAEIVATIMEQAFWYLDAPVLRVGAPHHPMPYQEKLELLTIPNAQAIINAVHHLAR